MFYFLLIFFTDIITPVISSTQIASDVTCEQRNSIVFILSKRMISYCIIFETNISIKMIIGC